MTKSKVGVSPAEILVTKTITVPAEGWVPLTDEVNDCLQRHPVLGAWGLKCVKKHRVRLSEILEYARDGNPHFPRLLVKHRAGMVPADRVLEGLQREYRGLEALWARAGPDLVNTVPKPVAFLPEVSAIVLEKLQGNDLRGILQRNCNRLVGPFRWHKTFKLGTAVGQWLRRFHVATAQPAARHDSTAYLASVWEFLEKCSTGGLDCTIHDEVWARVTRVSERLQGRMVPQAALQGDFTPINILTGSDRLAVVDFGGFKESAPIFEDAGMFMADLDIKSYSPLYSRKASDATASGFLEGYGETLDRELLDLYTFRSLLDFLARQFQNPSAGRARLKRRQEHLARALHRLFGRE